VDNFYKQSYPQEGANFVNNIGKFPRPRSSEQDRFGSAVMAF